MTPRSRQPDVESVHPVLLRDLLAEMAAAISSASALDAETRADARREARLLVAGAAGWAPGEVARRIDEPLPEGEPDRLRGLAARRARGEPLAYVTGVAAFRHVELQVDARVLIPRPETEMVVEAALRLSREHPGGIGVDIGTGSGAIALSLATEGHFEQVLATDISTDALVVAAQNAARIRPQTPIHFRHGADLAPLGGVLARVIVSNPPYIAYDEAARLPASVRDWEPATALFASEGGMSRYHALLSAAHHFLEPGGALVLEVDAHRGRETAARAVEYGWDSVQLLPDLSGRDRVLIARRNAGRFAEGSAGGGFTPQ